MSRPYHLKIPPEVADFIRHLHPQIKTKIRRGLEEIRTNPHIGKPLKDLLQGLYSYRISQYRIVYEIVREEILIEIVDIAERKIIYRRVAALLKKI